MAGILWLVQLVVYPAFSLVAPNDLPRYASAHATRITFIVGPLMLAELVSFLILLVLGTPFPAWLAIAAGFTLLVNWLSTFLWQVPLHARLQRAEADAISMLIRSNWLRTICWTTRAVLACLMLLVAMQGGK